MRREFDIVVTVDTPRGDAALVVKVEALDIRAAKFEAVRHCQAIGYLGVRLGFPRRKPPARVDTRQFALPLERSRAS